MSGLDVAWPFKVLIGAAGGLVAYWIVVSLWAGVVAVAAPRIQRDKAREELAARPTPEQLSTMTSERDTARAEAVKAVAWRERVEALLVLWHELMQLKSELDPLFMDPGSYSVEALDRKFSEWLDKAEERFAKPDLEWAEFRRSEADKPPVESRQDVLDRVTARRNWMSVNVLDPTQAPWTAIPGSQMWQRPG